MHVYGEAGKPLISTWRDETTGNEVIVQSEQMLDVAQKRPLTLDFIKEQFGRLGGTIFELQDVYMHITGNVILPVKELNRIRRQAVEQLIEKRQRPRLYIKQAVDLTSSYRQKQRAENPSLMALCRTLEQVEAACDTDVEMVYADFEFTTDYPKAVQIARATNKPIALATPRIHMPGENGILRGILKAEPDAILVRSLGAVQYYTNQSIEQTLIGDFSLNISNHLAAQLFLSRGLDRITPSYDLNIQQMIDLLEAAPTEHMEIVIHQHLPMFHTEHCVYCTFLSEGTDFTNCGRPCEKHRVSLRDRIGMLHPVRVDIGCRNTVYNAIEQSGAEYIPHFLSLGVRSYRVEFLEESAKKVEEVITLYREALEGKRSGTSVWRTLKAINQLGVTRGQLIKK